MRVLILGGTQFVGRHIAEAALARRWDVTLFHRGKTGADLFPEATHILGDRETDLARVGETSFDAVIDTCGYVPRVVGLSAAALVNKAKRYVFVSTISVYKEFATATDEATPTAEIADPTREDVIGETYGALKVLCEAVVTKTFGADRSAMIRPGVVAGPYDPTDRFTYWIRRAVVGGRCLAPGDGDRTFQVIDARDLAAFTLLAVERKLTGAFNATGDATSFRTLMTTAAQATGGRLDPVWLAEQEMQAHEVQGWSEMPLYIPGCDQRVMSDRAKGAGLTLRPLLETARATDRWDAERQRPALKTGITAAKEAAVLAAL